MWTQIVTYDAYIVLPESFHPDNYFPQQAGFRIPEVYTVNSVFTTLQTDLLDGGAPASVSKCCSRRSRNSSFLAELRLELMMTSVWHSFSPHKTFRKLTHCIYFNDPLLHKHEVICSCSTYNYQTNYEQRNKLSRAKKSHPYTVWLFAGILCVATGKR